MANVQAITGEVEKVWARSVLGHEQVGVQEVQALQGRVALLEVLAVLLGLAVGRQGKAPLGDHQVLQVDRCKEVQAQSADESNSWHVNEVIWIVLANDWWTGSTNP